MSFLPRPFISPARVRPIVGDPVPVVPQGTVPRAVDPGAAVPRVSGRLMLSRRTPTELLRGVLRATIGALAPAPDGRDLLRWEDEGGAPARGPWSIVAAGCAPPPVAGPRTSTLARDAVYAALGAYARAERGEGLGLPAVRAAVSDLVDDAAAGEAGGLLPPALLAAIQRDAVQCCRAAFAA